jgi:3-methylcrotonyl-CoA carboxylase alpha subunit
MLDGAEVWPVRTNAAFLFNAIIADEFCIADLDTNFIERHLDDLIPGAEADEEIWSAAAAVAWVANEAGADLPRPAGFRLNAQPRTSVTLASGDQSRTIELDGQVGDVTGFADGETVVVFREGQAFAFDLSSRGTVGAHGAADDGMIVAPMPGRSRP